MIHGTYQGPIAHLKGATALFRQEPAPRGGFQAQFDDVTLGLEGPLDTSQEGWEACSLGFGWHGSFRACPGGVFI